MNSGQANREARAARGTDGDGSAVCFGDGFDEGESEAASSPAGSRREESVEDPGEIVGRDAGATIVDVENGPTCAFAADPFSLHAPLHFLFAPALANDAGGRVVDAAPSDAAAK